MFKVLKIQIKNMNIMNLFFPLKKGMRPPHRAEERAREPHIGGHRAGAPHQLPDAWMP